RIRNSPRHVSWHFLASRRREHRGSCSPQTSPLLFSRLVRFDVRKPEAHQHFTAGVWAETMRKAGHTDSCPRLFSAWIIYSALPLSALEIPEQRTTIDSRNRVHRRALAFLNKQMQ